MNIVKKHIVYNFRAVGQYKIDFFAFLCYNIFVRLKKTLASNLFNTKENTTKKYIKKVSRYSLLVFPVSHNI